MSFDPSGDVLVTCGSDHAFQVVSCKSGKCVVVRPLVRPWLGRLTRVERLAG